MQEGEGLGGSWRWAGGWRCSVDPHAHDGLDCRFHPRRWGTRIFRSQELAAPERHCFLNTSTGECVQVGIPELHNHKLLAVTPRLPPLTTVLPSKFKDHGILEESDELFDTEFIAWGSGVASDGSTFVLCFNMLDLLATAKTGDDHWTPGRFYCVDNNGVMVLKTGADQPPCLEVAAKMDSIYAKMENMDDLEFQDNFHLVNNCVELMLGYLYDAYRLDLDTGTLFPVKSLGGSAGPLSLSVSLDVFPSGSIITDTIYLSFDDVGEREWLEVGGYHLTDGSVQRPNTNSSGLVPRPHTHLDCLSLSNTVRGIMPFP
ncbi:hypothetical protein VPH35_056617 [Triticum aestivum]